MADEKVNKVPTLTKIRDALGPWKSTQDFARQWRELPQADKDEIRSGVENGSLTY